MVKPPNTGLDVSASLPVDPVSTPLSPQPETAALRATHDGDARALRTRVTSREYADDCVARYLRAFVATGRYVD